MACGVSATRVSPGAVSRGTAIFIGQFLAFQRVTPTNRRSGRRVAVREAKCSTGSGATTKPSRLPASV